MPYGFREHNLLNPRDADTLGNLDTFQAGLETKNIFAIGVELLNKCVA